MVVSNYVNNKHASYRALVPQKRVKIGQNGLFFGAPITAAIYEGAMPTNSPPKSRATIKQNRGSVLQLYSARAGLRVPVLRYT
jgi:hypothetical protein